MIRAALFAVLLLCLAPVARAQEGARLIADSLSITATGTLEARGNIEVFYNGSRLQAQSIVYDPSTDRLRISGPIVLTEGGGSFILADQADLSADLSEGVLTSARLVLAQQLQLSASELMRVGGRYTVLGRTRASSCKVCKGSPTPLWEIRARRVIHDQEARQIYFEHASFRIAGVPVAYIPRLRMPDPTLDRAAGFLIPALRTTSGLGTGLKLPYFLPLGPSRDLTLTPYVSTRNARSLDLRYRQAFARGGIEISGAASFDDLHPGTRGYLLATGAFALRQGFALTFRGDAVSDDAYLLDYGLPQKDRLDSRVEITRTRRNEYLAGRLIHIRSIRDGEVNATLPTIIGDVTWHRRFRPEVLGGEGGFRFQSHARGRSSSSGADSDGDGISDGRDVSRASLRADWRRDWVLPGGLLGTALGEVTMDAYSVSQDAVFARRTTRLFGAAGVELRWPLVKAGAGGVTEVIEPVAQLVYAPGGSESLPNEDSALVEFDEGNLFSLNRFPGSDAVERGARANLGISYRRDDPDGWSLGVTVGRVYRQSEQGQFGTASGLQGTTSDWLVASQVSFAGALTLSNRLVFADARDITRAELRLDAAGARYGLTSSYVWAVADPSENRVVDTSELVLDARYRLSPGWTGKVSGRYDFVSARTARAGLGLEFRNECLKLDLSLSRRFTSSTSVQATTDFGLSVDLLGFGGDTAAGPARACRS